MRKRYLYIASLLLIATAAIYFASAPEAYAACYDGGWADGQDPINRCFNDAVSAFFDWWVS